MISFQGMTALITGASVGIGEAFARELARQGANLILTARSKEKLEALAAELREKTGDSPQTGMGTVPSFFHVIPCDLSRPEGPRQLFDAVTRANLQIDLLINNAGLGHLSRFDEIPEEKMVSMLQVNVCALTALTRYFLPSMLARKKGGILNVGSTAGFQPLPSIALYAATKAFVLSFTEALWAECRGKGIRVLCLCPGNTKTEFHARAEMHRWQVFFAASAEEVARFGLRIFSETTKPTVIHGWKNRIFSFGHRLVPRRWVVEIASLIYR